MESEYLIHCGRCEEAFFYNPGIKGERADLTKIFFVLHRSDSREPQPSSPSTYKSALLKSQTGKVLTEMLEFCGLTIGDVYVTNMFKCLLPKDREPKPREYISCIRILEKQIEDLNPEKIISFGHKTYKHMFPEIVKQKSFDEMIMHTLEFYKTPTLISYHPGWMWNFKTKKRIKHYEVIKKFLNNKPS